jgi:hypothetical protein
MLMKLKKVAFYGLLVAGVGLCVGGVFVPPLIPVGATLLAGAVAVAQNLTQSTQLQPQQARRVRPRAAVIEIVDQGNQSSDSLEVDLHIEHRKHLSHRLPKTFPEPTQRQEVDSKDDCNSSERESIQKHRP